MSLDQYEQQLIESLLSNAPRSLLELAEKAHASGFLSRGKKSQLQSLDPNVPHHLMCRYILMHAQRNMTYEKLMHWLGLLSSVGVADNILSQVRQYHDCSVSKPCICKGGSNFEFQEFEVSILTSILARYSGKWKVIGISLGLPDNIMKNIEAKSVNNPNEVSLNEVLLSWVRGESDLNEPPTLENLCKYLGSQLVGLGNIASNLKKRLDEVICNHHSLHVKVEDATENVPMHEEFRFVDQTVHKIVVTEGNSTLLEVQTVGSHKVINWQWCKKKNEHFTSLGRIYSDDIYSDDIYSDDIYSDDIYSDDIYSDDIYSDDIYSDDIYSDDIYSDDIYSDDIYSDDMDSDPDSDHDHMYDINDSILCISAKDLTTEGYYRCEVELDQTSNYSEPIFVKVRTPLDQYKPILVEKYIRSPKLCRDSWPPVSIDSFINLALIKQDSIHKAGQYGRCTIKGDMDDIFKDKESIKYDDAFGNLSSGARLLIEGRPGSGKTTLVHKFSRDWAKRKKIIEHIRLVFLIHLRGFCSNPNIGLCDLIHSYFSEKDPILEYAEKNDGLGLCFVLDGLDEYIPQRKDAYIYKLIRKQVLSKSVVIVASRPAAAADFRSIATRQIEVLGFLKDQIYGYIEKYKFSSPSKSYDRLCGYLNNHPNVLHMCYLPIHTCMLCFLYDIHVLGSDLPQTETQVYVDFTRATILRMLYRNDRNLCIESLSNLPEPHNQLYRAICKLAFEMTSSSRQVMNQAEVKDFFNYNDSLGLITVDIMAMACGFQKMYTFLHLTFQEFLSAFYISSQEEEEQLKIIKQFGGAIQMKQVWKFYCGLIQSESSSRKFTTLISQSQHGTLFNVQCSFEYQQPSSCDCVVDKDSLIFTDHFLTSSDLIAIAYVVLNAKKQCVMNIGFNKCTVGTEEVGIFLKKAHDRLSVITTLCYHGYDCVTEQLSVVNTLMHSLPSLIILDLSNTNLGPEEVDALTKELNHPNLQIVKVGSEGNSLYSSSGLPSQLAKRFSSGCSKLVNVCFSGSDDACLPGSTPFPFYFYCNHACLNMRSCILRPIEIQVLSDDLKCSCNCTELCLAGCGIDDTAASCIAEGLNFCKCLRTFDLSFNDIGDAGAVALATVGLIHCIDLEILELSSNSIGSKGAASLANSIKLYQKLRTLNLSLNRISDVGARALANSGLKTSVHLEILNLNCNNIGDKGAFSLADNVNKSLQKIDLSLNRICNAGAKAVVNATKCTNTDGILFDNVDIHTLTFSRCNFQDSSILCLLRFLDKYAVDHGVRHVSAFDISSNSISCHGAKSLSRCLKYFTHLKELNVSYNHIGSQGAIAIAESLKHFACYLDRLDMSRNEIGGKGIKALADALQYCTKLHALDISSNETQDSAAMVALGDALKHSYLRDLILSFNHIGCDGACSIASSFSQHLCKLHIKSCDIGVEGCKAITKALHHCIKLSELDISNNDMPQSCTVELAEALKHCTKLRKLDISCNNLGSDGAKVIAHSLSHCTYLEELAISNSSLGCNGVCFLARSFIKYENFFNLDISCNYIGNEGCNAIAKALQYCIHLRELNISNNFISDDGAKALVDALLKHCTDLKTLDIRSNRIGSTECKVITKRLQNCENLLILTL